MNSSRKYRPTYAVAARTVDLRKPRERGAQRIAHDGGHRNELCAVIQHLVVDLVGLIEQRPQNEVNQLADAVADEDFFSGYPGNAAPLLLHDDGFASGKDTFLVTIPFGIGQVLDHRQTHGFRGPEAECAWIADVQGDDLV